MVTVGSLFAGIGGFDLGLERAGYTTAWQVEIDPFCQRVLAKHWPHVRRHDDIRTFPPSDPAEWQVDLLCGGFPCQDVSKARRNREGLDGERSGLWSEYARVIGLLRPRVVLVENSATLTVSGLDRVLGSLATLGYDAEWATLPLHIVGSPQERMRVYLVAHDHRQRLAGQHRQRKQEGDTGRACPHAAGSVFGICPPTRQDWLPEPRLGRVVDGLSGRMDRIRSLGNSVSPAIAEWLGRRIKEVFFD